MNASQIIEELIEERKLSKTEYAAKLGIKPQALGNRLKRDSNLRESNLVAMLDALDYELLIVPKGTKLRDGFHPISGDDSNG